MRDPILYVPNELLKLYNLNEFNNSDGISYFNVIDDSGELTESGIEIAVPGIPKENIDVIIEGNKLTITAKPPTSQKNILYVGDTKSVTRSGLNIKYTIPDSYILSKLTASVKNGILTVVIPVSAKSKPRSVKIN